MNQVDYFLNYPIVFGVGFFINALVFDIGKPLASAIVGD